MMRHELNNESIPFDASMETVLPGLQAWQTANHQAVKAINGKVDSVVTVVNNISDRLEGGLLTEESQQLLKQDLAASLVSVARDLLRGEGVTRATESPTAQSEGATVVSPLDDASTVPQLATLTGALQQESPMIDPKAADHSNYRMTVKHHNLLAVYNEWYGLDEYSDDYGGIAGRDKLFKGAIWRTHLNSMQHSRTGRTVKAIEAFASEKNVSPEEASTSLQPAFEACKLSVGNFVKHCQEAGLLPKKKGRGKQAKKNS